MAVAIKGLKKLERKLKKLANKHGPGPVSRAALNGMAQPMKTAIRRGVAASSVSPEIKRAARETISSSVKKPRGGAYVLKVGFGTGKQSKVRRTKATARARQGGGRSVGISAQNIHWLVFGTGEGSVLAGKVLQTKGSKRVRKSRATGKARRHESGKFTGSTAPVLLGLIPVAIAGSIPAARRAGAAKAKVALRKEAKKRR